VGIEWMGFVEQGGCGDPYSRVHLSGQVGDI